MLDFYEGTETLLNDVFPVQSPKSCLRFNDGLFIVRGKKVIDILHMITRESRPTAILQDTPHIHHDSHLRSPPRPHFTILFKWDLENRCRAGPSSKTTCTAPGSEIFIKGRMELCEAPNKCATSLWWVLDNRMDEYSGISTMITDGPNRRRGIGGR